MAILALLNILLAKLSGQDDIIIGTPVAGRRHADLEGIVGMFVNTLAMRGWPHEDKSFTDFLEEVKIQTLHAFENQDCQFEELLDKISLPRDTGRNPLFDVMFTLMNQSEFKDDITGTDEGESSYKHIKGTAKFDLTWSAVAMEKKVLFNLEYCSHLFKPATSERIIEYFKKIVQAIPQLPFKRISQVDLLSQEEKQRILFINNAGHEAGYPEDKTIHGLFAEQVEKNPDSTAVVGPVLVGTRFIASGPGKQLIHLTYRQLNDRANQLAGLLIEKSIGPDTIVAIMVDRSVEMIVGIFGILKAGGAYLPIDPAYPEERKQYMLADSSTNMLVTTNDKEGEKLRRWEGEIIYIDELKRSTHSITLLPSHPLTFSPSHLLTFSPSSSLAYVIYTSGTTGKPKGVLIQHHNVVRLMFNDKFRFDFGSSDVWTLFHSFCFDFSVWEMYGALLYGGRLVVIPQGAARDPAAYLKILKERNVSVLNQTPSAFYHLVAEELKHESSQLKLKYVIFGGEALDPARLQKWYKKYPHTQLINMYGITETTVHVTYKEIGPQEIAFSRSNIGTAIPTLRTYVLGKGLNLLPSLVPGELCVGGRGVARGYLNRPGLSAEKFAANPYCPGETLYRSGDLVRMREVPGDLEYLGRIDQQIKIRGFRVEPGEIESRLLSCQDIKEAVVLVKEAGVSAEPANLAEPGITEAKETDRYLCAYFVASRAFTVTELRDRLSLYLPGYMIPSFFVQLEHIPLTVNGKIDRKALESYGKQLETGTTYEAPQNEIEKKIAEAWQEVLRLERVGIHDNCFDLGGTSFDILKINARLKECFQKDIPVVTMFTYPTVHTFAGYLSNIHQDKGPEIRDRTEVFKASRSGRIRQLQRRKGAGLEN